MDGKRQGAFWLSADERAHLIDSLNLPKSVTTPDGKTVRAMVLVAVLRQLNQRGDGDVWCVAAQEKIADEIKCSSKTVQRALKALVHLGLIHGERGRHAKHYRIEWDEIRVRTRYVGHPEREVTRTQMSESQCPSDKSHLDISSGHLDTGDSHLDILSGHLDTDVQQPCFNVNGIMNSMARGDGDLEKSEGKKRWTLRRGLTLEDLTQPDRIDALWRRAIDLRKFPKDSDGDPLGHWRLTFFGLCISLMRHYDEQRKAGRTDKGKIRNPIGLLHDKLDEGETEMMRQVTDEDRRKAKRLVQSLEGLDMTRTSDLMKQAVAENRPTPEQLESEFGPQLDSLEESVLALLISQCGRPLEEAGRLAWWRKHPRWRPVLLVKLYANSRRLVGAK